jgi:parallel beta-helix repeat protein
MRPTRVRSSLPKGRRRAALIAVAGGLLALPAGAAAQTPVTSCATVITVPGAYVLAQDLNCAGSTGVTINASNVTLSLNGKTITGGTTAVVITTGAGAPNSNVVVNGPGTFTGQAGAGGRIGMATASGFNNVTVTNSDSVGMVISGGAGADANFIRNSSITGNDVGSMQLQGGNGHEIAGNTCSNNLNSSAGIIVTADSDNNTIKENTCEGNYIGIALSDGSLGNQVTDNTATTNGGIDGFDLNANCGTNVWSGNKFTSFSPPCAGANPGDGAPPPPPPPAACTINGDAGNNTINGTAGNDVICGGEGADKLDGKGGDDILRGEGGVDRLIGGSGVDELDGGDGSDTANYDNTVGGVTVDLLADTATDQYGNSETVPNIENVLGGSLNDSISGDGGANLLEGRIGNDVLVGLGGADTLNGLAGDDTLMGGADKDMLYPGNGNDSVDGGSERDRLDLSFVTGGGMYVTLNGGWSSPLNGGQGGSDTIAAVEDVYGTAFDDTLIARINGVASTLAGLGGDDILDTRDSDSLDLASGGTGFNGCLTNGTDRRIDC